MYFYINICRSFYLKHCSKFLHYGWKTPFVTEPSTTYSGGNFLPRMIIVKYVAIAPPPPHHVIFFLQSKKWFLFLGENLQKHIVEVKCRFIYFFNHEINAFLLCVATVLSRVCSHDQKLIVQDKKKCFFNRLIAAYSYSMKNVYIIFNIFSFFQPKKRRRY